MISATETPIRYLPTWDRLLVRRKDTTRRESGLYLPASFKGQVCEGDVIAVGPGRIENGQRVDHGFKVGDVVVFSNEAVLPLDDEAPDQGFLAAGAVLALRAQG